MKINPSKVFYIKLGRGGSWEHECIYKTQTLRIGYNEIPHNLCIRGEWDKVREICKNFRSNSGAITRDINQVKNFYEAGENILWITFHATLLWWCFSKCDITNNPDNSKSRPVINKWQCTDIYGNKLRLDRLRGNLVSIQGFRGTICSVKDSPYLINKINGFMPKEVKETEDNLIELENKLETLIKRLHWKDFEILIDLIFRQAGWQRVSKLGGAQKTIDLDLISPITEERYAVQIKSKADLATFENYQKKFEDMQGYSRFYFLVHSPSSNLENALETEEFQLILPHKISRLAIKYGLTDWIIGKF